MNQESKIFKHKFAVLDLEFLAFKENAIVTAGAVVALDSDGNETDRFSGRVAQDSITEQVEMGGVAEKETVEWADEQGMVKILSDLDTHSIRTLMMNLAQIVNESHYIVERTSGADIPKLRYWCQRLGISLDIKYWQEIEIRSYLLGANCHFLNKCWGEGLVKHNPLHDCLMDSNRLGLARRIVTLDSGHHSMIRFVYANGGEFKEVRETLESYVDAEMQGKDMSKGEEESDE